MSQDLNIKLNLDTSPALAENKKFAGEHKKVEAEVLEDANKTERGKAQASK